MKNIFNKLFNNNRYKEYLPIFKKEKNKQYLALILTLSASIFFALFAINPTLSTIAKLRKEVADSKLVDQKLSEKIGNLSTLSQQYVAIKDDVGVITSSVPESAQAPNLIAQIQSVAKTSNISISTLEVSPIQLTDNAAKTHSFTFDLTATGDYQSFINFISAINSMQRVVSLDLISITKQSDNLQLTTKGTAYFIK